MRRRRRERRNALIQMLGGKCKRCGAETNLEPHHTEPRTWASRDVWAIKRLKLYLIEAAAGKLVLLCRACNAALGQPAGENDNF